VQEFNLGADGIKKKQLYWLNGMKMYKQPATMDGFVCP
jgi:hypothetical protein